MMFILYYDLFQAVFGCFSAINDSRVSKIGTHANLDILVLIFLVQNDIVSQYTFSSLCHNYIKWCNLAYCGPSLKISCISLRNSRWKKFRFMRWLGKVIWRLFGTQLPSSTSKKGEQTSKNMQKIKYYWLLGLSIIY